MSLAIIAYLVYDAKRNEAFSSLMDQPKHWSYFAVAWMLCMTAACLTMIRWYYLVRALELPFRLSDAFRLGFLGYLLNFVAPGNVGGDLFKAAFVAREQTGKRAEAVATVVIDRVIGLYVLFVIASGASLFTGVVSSPVPELQLLGQATILCTIAGGIFIFVLLVPRFTLGRFSKHLREMPGLGHILGRLLDAIRIYRNRLGTLVLASVLSILVQVMNTLGVYLVARGLPGESPTLAAHFIIVPLAMVAGALPLLPSGLGVFEGVIDFLYRVVPGSLSVKSGEGLLVAFGYRAITIAIALVGIVFYLRNRREIDAAREEAEHLATGDDETANKQKFNAAT